MRYYVDQEKALYRFEGDFPSDFSTSDLKAPLFDLDNESQLRVSIGE